MFRFCCCCAVGLLELSLLARRWARAWRPRASVGRARARRRRKMRKVSAFHLLYSLKSLALNHCFQLINLISSCDYSSSPCGHWHQCEPPGPVSCHSEGMVSESLSHHSSCSISSMEFSHLSPEIYSENRVLIHCIFYCKSHIETTSYILLHYNQFGRIHSIALLHICLLLCSGDFNGQDHRCEAAALRQHRHVCHHKLLSHTWGECQNSHGVAAKVNLGW